MKKILLALLLAVTPATAQTVRQSGTTTPGHAAVWITTGVIGDGGPPSGGGTITGASTVNDFVCIGMSGTLIDCGLSATATNNWSGLQNLNGGATAPTRSPGDNSTNVATTAFVTAAQAAAGANPTGVVGLSAVNGSATTFLRSDGAPALSQAIVPTWTGIHTFTGASTTVGAVNITPPSSTIDLALSITQTSPSNNTPITGPVHFNEIDINAAADVTGADNRQVGLWMQYITGGTNQKGRSIGAFINMNHSVASSSGGDHLGFVCSYTTNVVDTSGGEGYGCNSVSVANSGASMTSLIAHEFDSQIDAGATVPRREVTRIVNQGATRAGTTDAGLSFLSTNSGGSFSNGILLTTHFGAAPIAAAGNFISDDGNAQTMANFINAPNITISDSILKFPTYVVKGTGATQIGSGAINSGELLQVSANAAALPAASFSGTLVHIGGVDAGNTRLLIDDFGASAATLNFRHALGTAASPSAITSGTSLGSVSFSGYGASQYNATDSALISAVASQSFTNTVAGTEFTFNPIANGGLTSAEAIRILNGGNLKFTNASNFAANNARTVTISNVGPATISATIAKWLTFQDSAGTVSYVPVWQ